MQDEGSRAWTTDDRFPGRQLIQCDKVAFCRRCSLSFPYIKLELIEIRIVLLEDLVGP